tara:strand:- start:941 stop:1159 length:219 start_codon:yes stop_codon:yes gene_type:complete
MRTYTSITYIANNIERTKSFIRPYSAKKPTFLGAARMISDSHNKNRFDESEKQIKPSDISVMRIEFCDYCCR